MLKHPFLEAIQNQILVWDSAAGTQLRERIPPYVQCLNACNIHQDYFHIVQNFHQEYRNKGADILQTNTFGANATKLKNYGFEMQVAEINRAGAVLAREIAGDERYVAGSVGPLEMDALGEHFDGS
jgi:methionine synthase I (cobalamin-dependent)